MSGRDKDRLRDGARLAAVALGELLQRQAETDKARRARELRGILELKDQRDRDAIAIRLGEGKRRAD